MNWEHRCDLEWLRDRQKYITASDIKKLLPVTATGRPRKVGDEEYLKVMSSKMVQLTEEDCMSYGAAARGHIMEPYAIDALNGMLSDMRSGNPGETFYWWDDKIVSLPGRTLAFSPDAMDVPMVDEYDTPHAIAEVKSYGAEKHLLTAYTPKDKIEERWQIASAMALLDSIDHAYLVLFNPKMKKRRIFVIRFDRSELEKEIETVLEVEGNWTKFRMVGPLTKKSPNGAIWSGRGGSEQSIAKTYEEHMRLNPI